MLACDETFNYSGDTSLLLDIDQRFELHRRREGSESGENLRVCWGLEGICFRIDAHRFIWRSRIDQIRQLGVAMQLRKILT